MDTRHWYYAIEQEQQGPVPEAELIAMIESGCLNGDTMIWTEGWEQWSAVSSIQYLAAHLVEEAPAPPAMVVYAGFWKRLAAGLIDALLTGSLGFVIGFIFGAAYVAIMGTVEGVEFAGQVLGIFLGWVYAAVMESSQLQATVGKLALGVRVTDLEGRRLTFGRASGRHFAKIISGLAFLIGYFMIGFTERKQGLHDIMAGCLVVNK